MELLPSLFLIISVGSLGAYSVTFTVTNNCSYTVWPSVVGNATLGTTGFSLDEGESKLVNVPANWSVGQVWGRTLCTTDLSTGDFTCGTADCGSNNIQCSTYASSPATVAEFRLDSGGRDFYDVSLVDGFNLPMSVVPQAGRGKCSTTGCFVDLNRACPTAFKVMMSNNVVGCRSACDVFQTDEYCCTGQNASNCKPTEYSQIFKRACPRAYSYPEDDASSAFNCTSGAGYSITFCPGTSSQRIEGAPPAHEIPALPAGDNPARNPDSPSVVAINGTPWSHPLPLWMALVSASWLLLHRLF